MIFHDFHLRHSKVQPKQVWQDPALSDIAERKSAISGGSAMNQHVQIEQIQPFLDIVRLHHFQLKECLALTGTAWSFSNTGCLELRIISL